MSFNETYRSLYSVLNDSFGIEVLNWRVRVAGPSADLWFGSDDASDTVERVSRSVWEPASQSFVEAPVYFQAAMEVGPSFKGPLVVEQRETTADGKFTIAVKSTSGNLVIQVGREGAGRRARLEIRSLEIMWQRLLSCRPGGSNAPPHILLDCGRSLPRLPLRDHRLRRHIRSPSRTTARSCS